MNAMDAGTDSGGQRIAIKLPNSDYDENVRFYKEVVKLPVIEESDDVSVFEFGDVTLTLDRESGFDNTDIWLEMETDNKTETSDLPSPEQLDGFFVSTPEAMLRLLAAE